MNKKIIDGECIMKI